MFQKLLNMAAVWKCGYIFESVVRIIGREMESLRKKCF